MTAGATIARARIRVEREAEMVALAERLVPLLAPPLLVGLSGELGAGKTFLVRALAAADSPARARDVSSPTWSVVNSYGSDPVWRHLDLYRMHGEDDFASLGFEDLACDAISLVEWPERVPSLLARLDLHLDLRHAGEEAREVRMVGITPRGAAVVAGVRAALGG